MIMLERCHFLLIGSVLLNCVLTVCLLFTCIEKNNQINTAPSVESITETGVGNIVEDIDVEIGKDTANVLEKPLEGYVYGTLAEQQQRQEAANQRTDGIDAPYAGNRTSVQVSHTTYRPPSPLRGISGRVNTNEINPINFENPDINILTQMGADRHLISYFTGEQFYKAGDYDKALTEYTAAINIYANFTEAFISRGNTWLKKSNWSRAIDDFSRAIRLEGNRAELYNYRGFARTQRGENNLAIEDFTRAISINTNYVDALINRSHV